MLAPQEAQALLARFERVARKPPATQPAPASARPKGKPRRLVPTADASQAAELSKYAGRAAVKRMN
jgi:hypothetical protein